MQVDMSPAAITRRMNTLDELWELAMALKSSVIVENIPSSRVEKVKNDESSDDDKK